VIAARGVFHCGSGLLLLATFGLPISYWSALALTGKEIPTPAGPLAIEHVNDQEPSREFKVCLGHLNVLHSKGGDATTEFPEFPDFPEPVLIGHFREPIGVFDFVAVFQQFSSGNACNGGPISFLGISGGGGFTRSKPIDNCGGLAPQVTVNQGVIHLTLPQSGQAAPAEEWTYSGRELERTR